MKLNKIFITFFLLVYSVQVNAFSIMIPMDEASQKNHLKAYGIAFWTLQNGLTMQWLLNYRGGSFLLPQSKAIEEECIVRGVSYEILTDGQTAQILNEISQPEANMDALKLEKAPRIAVYSPKTLQPWDDAVTMVLTYAEIPYTIIYDEEIIQGDLTKFDWLHLHHEDFTGQYGKFYAAYRNAAWYKQEVAGQSNSASKLGFMKVSQMKLFVAKTIKDFVSKGGFLFAMCSATDTYDICLASDGVDICESMFDGDGADPSAQQKLNYDNCFAFKNFSLAMNPMIYEFSDIDVTNTRRISRDNDFFTLFDFSAKWDPVPTMLCQNHSNLIKGFMGQCTAYNKTLIKSSALVMGEFKSANEARYIHGEFGKGTWTYFGGHDPEDYQHFVGDPPTDLNLYPNSPGYRLILNNILFPAAKKKKLKT